MLLFILFAVLFASVTMSYYAATNPGGLLFCVAAIQENHAGTLATRPGLFSAVILSFDALQAFLSAFSLVPYNYIILILKRLKRANNRTTAPYTTDKSNRAESKNHHPETVPGRFSQSGRKIKISIFCHFISKLWPQKPLGCVSKIEILKNPKILDRGDF